MPRIVRDTRRCITVVHLNSGSCEFDESLIILLAIAEGHGDAALLLLKEGAETDKEDVDGQLAIDLAPDKKVCCTSFPSQIPVLILEER